MRVEWIFPASVDEAVALLARPGHQAIAGGTTVLDLMKLGHRPGPVLVDISRLDLTEISEGGGIIRIGAMVSNSQAARSPLIRERLPALSEAILMGASEQIRNAASIGGNLMQATRCGYFRDLAWPCNRRTEGSGCAARMTPAAGHAVLGASAACIATQPSDMAVALLAFDAVVVARTIEGTVRISVAGFFRGPDEKALPATRLPQGALITGIEIPAPAGPEASGYVKLRGRASYEFASASVAARLEFDGDVLGRAAIAFGGIATTPWRDREAEQLLIGAPLGRAQVGLYLDRALAGADTRPETAHKIPLARGAVHHLLERLAK